MSCWTLQQIRDGDARGLAPVPQGLRFYGLVPDGVTTVVLRRPDGHVATGRVRDNFIDIATPASSSDRLGIVQWVDDHGHVVRDLTID
jgi:hypothetical protein